MILPNFPFSARGCAYPVFGDLEIEGSLFWVLRRSYVGRFIGPAKMLEATASGSRLFLCPEFEKSNVLELRPQQNALSKYREGKKKPTRNNVVSGSNSLTNGGPSRTRTCDQEIMSLLL
jgi:hypothetical protein